jgi:hypothetical protein
MGVRIKNHLVASFLISVSYYFITKKICGKFVKKRLKKGSFLKLGKALKKYKKIFKKSLAKKLSV